MTNKAAIAIPSPAITMTQPSQKRGLCPASGNQVEIMRLTIAPVPTVGNPSAGEIASQASHVPPPPQAASPPSILALAVGAPNEVVNAVRHMAHPVEYHVQEGLQQWVQAFR